MFSERSISAVPIIDEEGVVVNLYETVDVIVSLILFSSCDIFIFWVNNRRSCDWERINLLTSRYLKRLTNDCPISQVWSSVRLQTL